MCFSPDGQRLAGTVVSQQSELGLAQQNTSTAKELSIEAITWQAESVPWPSSQSWASHSANILMSQSNWVTLPEWGIALFKAK